MIESLTAENLIVLNDATQRFDLLKNAKRYALICFVAAMASLTALAQNPTQTPPPASTQPSAPAPPPAKPRVFLQAQSRGNTYYAARDQSMEMSKDFDEVCPAVRITVNPQMADYTVSLNHLELGLLVRDNQFQLSSRNGDLLSKAEVGSIRGGVKKFCDLILADWAEGKARGNAQMQAAADTAPAADTLAATAPAAAQAADQAQAADPAPATELTFISTPDGADVELDGAFVGSTPSTISVANGDHMVRVSKKGYQPYEKKLRTTGGTVSLRADLDVAGQ